MKKYLFIVATIVLMTMLFSSCGGDTDSEAETVEPERAISIKAEVVCLTDAQIVRSFTGSLEGEKQAVIYAKIAEAVDKVAVREGESVKANTILLELDRTGPSSNFLQSQSIFVNAEKNYKKMEYLYGEGAISESQFDAAKTDYEVARASFDAAAQLVYIKSPISGIVTSLDVSEGDFVQVGKKLATVATTEKLRVKFGVNDADIKFFENGLELYVTSQVASEPAHGKVVATANSADPVTRAFEVEAIIDNAQGYYKPGMFVRINTVRENLDGVIAIPRRAVLTLDGKETVFVVDNAVAGKREVTLGPEIDGRIVITSGLDVGDTVVTLGQDYLDEGSKVNVTALSEGQ